MIIMLREVSEYRRLYIPVSDRVCLRARCLLEDKYLFVFIMAQEVCYDAMRVRCHASF